MTHIVRPPSESAFPAADALLNFPRCIVTLEAAVRDVLAEFWEDKRRAKAHDLARSMSGGCKVCGFREASGVIRSLESLLALSPPEAAEIRLSLAERMLDLIGLLKDQSRRTSAGSSRTSGIVQPG